VVSSGGDLQDKRSPIAAMGQSLAAGHLDFTAVLFGEDMHMVELRKRQLMTQDGLVAERSFSIVHIAQRSIYIARHLKSVFPSHFSACA
jgi:hypothetical protein